MTDLNDADGIVGVPPENIDADERLNPFSDFLDDYYNLLDVCRGQGNPKVEENGLTLNLQFNPNEIYGAGHLVLDKTKVNELKDDEKLLLIVRRKLQRRTEFYEPQRRPTLNKTTAETRRVVPDVEKPTSKVIKTGSIPLKDVDNIQQIVSDVCDWLGDRVAAFALLFQDKRRRTEDE